MRLFDVVRGKWPRRSMPKLVECLGNGYGWTGLRADLAAGLTVAVVALPLAMAFAIASGLPPERGLYTAIVAGVIISLLGGSRFQIGGPTGAFIVVVSSVLGRHGYDGLMLATLLASVLLLLLAFSGLGAMIRYIPYPVTTGFTVGIAVIIFSTQIKDLLGLNMTAPSSFIDKWTAYAHCAGGMNGFAAVIGAGGVAAIMAMRRFVPRMPSVLVFVIASSLAAAMFHLPVETIGSRFGEIPNMLPHPTFPAMDEVHIRAVLPDALTIAFLVAIESLLSAVVADSMSGDRHRPNVEIFAQGIANLGSVVMGGIPATGAIARTATNIRAGANGPLAGVFHAAFLLVIMVTAAPLAKMIPLAALAAVLVVVSYDMSEIKHIRHLLRAPRSDLAVFCVTLALTVLADLNTAIEVGVILAALLFMKRMIAVSEVARSGWLNEEMDPGLLALRMEMPEVEIFEIAGPFFFGLSDKVKTILEQVTGASRVFILNMQQTPAIDATGLHSLTTLSTHCRKQGKTLILCGLHGQVKRAITRHSLHEAIGDDNLCHDLSGALMRARTLLRNDPSPQIYPL